MADRDRGRDWVAVILAVAIGTAVNLLMAAMLYDALRSDTPGLSENATQVITGAFAGIVGVLGGYVGGRNAERRDRRGDDGPPDVDSM